LLKLKKEAETIHDNLAESIFWPLINAILVIVYSSIARKRNETYQERISSCKTINVDLEAKKNLNKGKIDVLKDVRKDIARSAGLNEEDLISKAKNSIKGDKNEVVTGTGSFNNSSTNDSIKQIFEESEEIVENLKRIQNEQEGEFHSYLKSLGDIIVSQKILKKA